ncbi:hypothetical protein GALL_291760 [mine drainage metagenome]|uniref:Uncharacterized protein n=1 Tax=mine drainage metagenome TaxID=410659 RepID=A0A1J5QZ03_9ZZZZ
MSATATGGDAAGWTRLPLARSLEVVGDEDAGLCVDGVCVIPPTVGRAAREAAPRSRAVPAVAGDGAAIETPGEDG